MTKNYFDDLKDDIKEALEKLETGRTQVEDEDEKEALIKEAIQFYNTHPEDKDVFRYKNVCVLLIQTPEKQVNDNGKIANTLREFSSKYNPEESNWLLNGCKFRIYGKTEFISVFATKSQWKEIGIYGKKALITGNLKEQYKLLEDMNDNGIRPMGLKEFLSHCRASGYDVKTLKDLDDANYRTYYSTNVIQVLYAD